MTVEISELERQRDELAMKQVSGKPKHVEINERTLEAYKKAYEDKGLVITKEQEYPQEDFHSVKKQKAFDALVDPTQGIKKIIGSMIRQPVTIFNKNRKPEVKDALYFNGYWYGLDKRGTEIGAPFSEGSFKRPKLAFTSSDAANPYDPKTGERRGQYKAIGSTIEHYIYLPEDKKERRKQSEEILEKATGTYTGNLSNGHLHYRNPSPNNDHSGTHGGLINWDHFCDLSLQQLGELQNKNYYKDSSGILKDKDGHTVKYNDGKIKAIK